MPAVFELNFYSTGILLYSTEVNSGFYPFKTDKKINPVLWIRETIIIYSYYLRSDSNTGDETDAKLYRPKSTDFPLEKHLKMGSQFFSNNIAQSYSLIHTFTVDIDGRKSLYYNIFNMKEIYNKDMSHILSKDKMLKRFGTLFFYL